ncbi:TonB-dependent receptor [Hymenobacter arizonensis]|uniref:Iron complex outermembrane recepter protein n=1 Tax=Hymenobacter arizonensis TaxID=1227077 RepID=A0A1I5WU78_HYMAR|nr:TonB-dependent receptor [Hymenobacter arizonensis]SFQ23284.1 iron complex outermembrane recepter protein [Hymenobacter arizonensis]
MKALLLFLLLLPTLLRGQTGTLTGAIHDAKHSAVPFASVAIVGTGLGATADAAGRFRLPNVPAGTLRLHLSAVGYTAAERDTTLAEGQTLNLQLLLTGEPAVLNEVVVTGVSRATEIRRSPVPIATLARREINLNANTNVIDAAVRGIPGLSAVTTGPNVSKPFIRGLGYNRVLTLYNGLRQEGQQWGDEHGVEIDGYDIERVEVVKGPASLLYGSDAVAGVVNLLPGLPSGPEGQLGGEALTEYQSNNGLIGNSLGLNYQKNGFQTSFRTSHRLARDYRNRVDGLVYNTGFREFNLTGMAGVVKPWGSSHWYLTLYDNQQEIPDGSRDSLSRAFTRQVAESELDDIKNRPRVGRGELKSYAIAPLHQSIRHYRIFTKTQMQLGSGQLNLLLGAQQNRRREFNHPTAPAQPGLALDLTTYTYDVRYHLPAWQGLEMSVGSNGMAQVNRHQDATDFPIPDYNLLDAGTFLLIKKPLGKLELSGGLRYDTRLVTWDDFYVAPNPRTGFEGAAGPRTADAELQFPAFQRRYQGVSASLGASYVATEQLTLRANLARGYRAPNIPEIGSNGLDPGAHIVYLGNRSFQPEFSWQQDVGMLWHQPTLDASVEVFHNYVENFIYQARLLDAVGQPVVIVPGNTTYQFQQAAARLYGIEASLNVRPAALPWLALSSSMALVNGQNEDAKLVENQGNAARYLPLIPPLRARAEARATLPARAGRLTGTYFRASLDGSARQNRFYALDNTETATPGYALLGLGAGTTFRTRAGREAVQLFLQVDNVLDVAYQSHLNRLKYFEYYEGSPNGRSGIYNPGRNVSAKVVVPF